jgi:hypothetical protein
MDMVAYAKTVTGEQIDLVSSSAIIMLDKIEFPVTVDTFSTCQETLIGRKFIENLILELNGIRNLLIITLPDR